MQSRPVFQILGLWDCRTEAYKCLHSSTCSCSAILLSNSMDSRCGEGIQGKSGLVVRSALPDSMQEIIGLNTGAAKKLTGSMECLQYFQNGYFWFSRSADQYHFTLWCTQRPFVEIQTHLTCFRPVLNLAVGLCCLILSIVDMIFQTLQAVHGLLMKLWGQVSPTPVKSPVYWTPVISNCQLNWTRVSPTKVNFCPAPVRWLRD